MMSQRVSTIPVDRISPNIAAFFVGVGKGKIQPQAGILVHRIGEGRYLASRMLQSGGKADMVLEIVNGVLQVAGN